MTLKISMYASHAQMLRLHGRKPSIFIQCSNLSTMSCSQKIRQ